MPKTLHKVFGGWMWLDSEFRAHLWAKALVLAQSQAYQSTFIVDASSMNDILSFSFRTE